MVHGQSQILKLFVRTKCGHVSNFTMNQKCNWETMGNKQSVVKCLTPFRNLELVNRLVSCPTRYAYAEHMALKYNWLIICHKQRSRERVEWQFDFNEGNRFGLREGYANRIVPKAYFRSLPKRNPYSVVGHIISVTQYSTLGVNVRQKDQNFQLSLTYNGQNWAQLRALGKHKSTNKKTDRSCSCNKPESLSLSYRCKQTLIKLNYRIRNCKHKPNSDKGSFLITLNVTSVKPSPQ